MTLPTRLTLFRMVLTFVIMGLLFLPGVPAKGACLGLFLLAALTDWWDGLLARRLNQITPLGILLDPIADKVLVLGVFLTFVQLRLVPAWMVLVIVTRELLITGVRLYAVSRQIAIPAAREGKHKTISQMLTIIVILAVLVIRELLAGQQAVGFERIAPLLMHGLMLVTVVLTVVSGASFFWRNRFVLKDAMGR